MQLYENIDNLRKIADVMAIKLHENNIVADISYRLKDPYSILKKMLKKNIDFHQITDIIAFRIIVDSQQDCYDVLAIINEMYLTNSEKSEDYIANPKDNGYSSLHIVIIVGNSKRNIEIQIRTQQMHDIAEFGTANHDQYKQAQESRLKKLFSTELLNVAAIHKVLGSSCSIFEKFNWTIYELVTYEQEIKNLWHNFQDNLSEIPERFIEE
jgi:(p)ppGpp synthase/HD superfamily hydrolase